MHWEPNLLYTGGRAGVAAKDIAVDAACEGYVPERPTPLHPSVYRNSS